jgi:hypothetical protein
MSGYAILASGGSDMPIETLTIIIFTISSLPLSVGDIPTKLALLATTIAAIASGSAGVAYLIGIALQYGPVSTIAPGLAEHGQRLKMSSLKALFEIGIFGGLASLIVWIIALLMTACEPDCATSYLILP